MTIQTVEGDTPLMIDLKRVAAMLSLSPRSVIRLHKDGKIRLYRLGGKLFAKYEELIEDLDAALEPVLSNS